MKGWKLTAVSIFMFLAMMAVLGMVTLPVFREAIFKPKPIDRKMAIDELRPMLRDNVTTIHIPAVNADINLIYVTASLTPDTIQRIKEQGRARADLPGNAWQFPAARRVCLVNLRESPAKIVIGDQRNDRHWELAENYYSKWISAGELPWRE